MMKYIIKAILIATGALLLNACGDDYLNTSPRSLVSPDRVFATTENAAYAIGGLSRLMLTEYFNKYVGEGSIKMYIGNYQGMHLGLPATGYTNTVNHKYNVNAAYGLTYLPWYYYYGLIGNANVIVKEIDAAEGPQEDKAYIKAQALSFRAYAYLMLAQVYGYRWSDSKSGSTNGVALVLEPTEESYPLSTLQEVYAQIYKDLDEAIALYESSGRDNSTAPYYPSINMAYGVYARAALTKQDYATARKYAVLAREGFPLMSNEEYQSGFCVANKEWIWGTYDNSVEAELVLSFHAFVGYNSTGATLKEYPNLVSRKLYEQMPATDIRKSMFLDPTGYEGSYNEETGQAVKDSALDKHARQLRPDINEKAKTFAYMQFKIATKENPGVGELNHIRSAEMYLIEAEASYFTGDEENARKLLVELNKDSGRDPQYSCDKTGNDLLAEIKKYRAIELWGEGFDWFDLKRWGDTLVRQDHTGGGNFLSAHAVTIAPEDDNRWTFVIPERETNYNDSIR